MKDHMSTIHSRGREDNEEGSHKKKGFHTDQTEDQTEDEVRDASWKG
jgi:hypothetical protein